MPEGRLQGPAMSCHPSWAKVVAGHHLPHRNGLVVSVVTAKEIEVGLRKRNGTRT